MTWTAITETTTTQGKKHLQLFVFHILQIKPPNRSAYRGLGKMFDINDEVIPDAKAFVGLFFGQDTYRNGRKALP